MLEIKQRRTKNHIVFRATLSDGKSYAIGFTHGVPIEQATKMARNSFAMQERIIAEALRD